jgi:hypothetical protein
MIYMKSEAPRDRQPPRRPASRWRGSRHDYGLNASSLHRHRTNCLKLASSNVIKKEAAQGTAAVALLPSKETLGGAYLDLAQSY